MMHTAVFIVIGIMSVSLAVSHPTPDYRSRNPLVDNYLRSPRVPLLEKDDTLKQQSKQLGSLATALLLTPLIFGGLGGLGGNTGVRPILAGNTAGTATTTGLVARPTNRAPENIGAYVVNIPGSSGPHLYYAQRQDGLGAPSASAASLVPPFVTPLEPPFASPTAVPLPYPAIIHGNVLPPQHFVSSNQVFVPFLPSFEGTKDDAKSSAIQNVKESSIRSGAAESSNN